VVLIALLAAAMPLLASPARSQAQTPSAAVTPHNNIAAIFDLLSTQKQFAADRPALDAVRQDLVSEHYKVRWYGQGGNSGGATLTNFVKLGQASVIIINTHANPTGLRVQEYRTEDAGQRSYDRYVRKYGSQSTQWFKLLQFPTRLFVTAAGIRHFFSSKRIDLIFGMACDAFVLHSAFNAKAYFGYGGTFTCGIHTADPPLLFSRMTGTAGTGVENRTTTGAYGLGGFVNVGGSRLLLAPTARPVVLSPAVESATPEAGDSIGSGTSPGEVQFDSQMDTDNTDGVLTASGCGAKVINPRWGEDDAVLNFDLKIPAKHAGNTLTLTVHADQALGAPGRSANDGLDGNTDPNSQSGVAPSGDDYEWKVQCGGLTVRGLDPSLVCSKVASGCVHGPPASPICGVPATWSQFSVSATGLVPGMTYDLSLGGTAHGVSESKPIGALTADKSGNAPAQVFTLPPIPAHDPWTLTAKPRGSGQSVTTTLETGEIDCVLMFAGGGSFRSQIAAVGLAPSSPFQEVVDGTPEGAFQADTNGTVPATEVDGTCQSGQVHVVLSGDWLDHGTFTDDATNGVDQFC